MAGENNARIDYPQAQHVHHLLEVQARLRPTAIAIAAPGRTSLTYGGLYAQAESIAKTLNALGVGRNDRVAIVLPNGPEMAVAFIAVAACATSAPLNPAYRVEEFDFYLSDMKAKALIVAAGIESPARKAAQALGVTIIELSPVLEAEAGVFTLTGAVRTPTANPGFAQSDDVALVLHTSGTTSRPKLVPLTQTNFCVSARNMSMSCELSETDRCLNVMPLFHAHAIMTSLASSLVAGASVVCTPGFVADSFFDWMAKFRPTWYTAVPTIHQAILSLAAQNQDVIATTPLRFVRSASSSLPAQVLAKLESTFQAPVIEAYGMTEACSQVASNPLPPQPHKVRSVGIATGNEVAIMDKDGELLSPGAVGEIVIRGTNVTSGYENNPEANASAFTNDGWFKTGDQGYLDDDNYLFITGRIKEIINRGGRKVSPREVDEALMEHPDIAQAITFARPHITLGEDVVASVVLRPGTSTQDWEIRQFALRRLADYKVPSQILIVDQIPKGATGKVQRLSLYEKLGPKLKAEFVLPGNAIEETLAQIWREALGLEKVGIKDNFFDLGGDSILIAKVQAKIQETLGKDLTVTDIFAYATISALAQHLSQEESAPSGLPQQEAQVDKLEKGKSRLLQQRKQSQGVVKEKKGGRSKPR